LAAPRASFHLQFLNLEFATLVEEKSGKQQIKSDCSLPADFSK